MSTQNTNDLFVTAARKKFRFDSNRGQLSTEDLFDLKLEALDTIAIALDKKINEAAGKSFVKTRAASTTELDTQLEIVKFVIATKQAEDEAKKVRVAKDSQRAFLNELLQKKRVEQLEGLSLDEIQAQLAAIGD